jgi:glutamate 5-kinase
MQNGAIKRNGLPVNIRRLVVKAGSRVLVDDKGSPDLARISQITSELATLFKRRLDVILVSSGAIAAGVQSLELKNRPSTLPELQMAAAVGQSVLMNMYASGFSRYDIPVGQILLTHDDLNNRERHLNARNTMLAMLRNRVLPIVNENDVIAVDEIRFGDNDVLASMVATLIPTDLLIILTTSDGFYRMENGIMKERISALRNITSETFAMAQGKGSAWSSGGMSSKLKAAQNAARTGTSVVIANGTNANVIHQILDGDDIGTLIPPYGDHNQLKARKKWIAFFHRPQGSVIVDDGAKDAICLHGNSLLPVGIHRTEGNFHMGSVVNIKTANGKIIARGLTSYSREDVERIRGRRSADIPALIGACRYEEVIHRDNMVLLDEGE